MGLSLFFIFAKIYADLILNTIFEDIPLNSPPLEGWISKFKEFWKTGWSINTTMKEILTTINGIPIRRNFVTNLPYNSYLKVLLKEKRKARILGEVIFWKKVRAKIFHEIDFDRQRIIGNYIVDFYVKALGLIVEIDGSIHDKKQVYDEMREKYFESLGLLVFKISDFDVRNNLNLAMKELEDFIWNHPVFKNLQFLNPPLRGRGISSSEPESLFQK
ncbi:endonuclease domain-containing protein [Chryseobacterium sp. NRRL B-14859]|uniref:endonuclease domain-containing protein n=1 Tax=Chryseobacterium sp. NRRL B-14859 TaxID=1562763 RepID=UPI00339B1347